MTALPAQSVAPATARTAGSIAPATAPPTTDDRPALQVAPARGRGRLLLTVASLLVLAAAVFAAVTLNAVAADDAVVAQQLEGAIREARSANGSLVTEVARLESPARIAAAASELGLVAVNDPRQLRVERLLPADGIVHDRVSGAAPFADD